MSEQMLMTQALDERDLLVKKIGDKLDAFKATDAKKRNEPTTQASKMDEADFRQKTESASQQITDLINRYIRLDAAIIASNSKTVLNTPMGPITVAAAIALRARLTGKGIFGEKAQFEVKLANASQESYDGTVRRASMANSLLAQRAETMQSAILGKESANKEARPLDVIDTYIRENTVDVIDPMNAIETAQVLREKIDADVKMLDTAIKVSNATTTIEF